MRPHLSLGSALRIPIVLFAMLVATSGLLFFTRRVGLEGDLWGYAPIAGGFVAGYAALRGLGRLMPFRGIQFVTCDGLTVTLWGLEGRSVEFPVDGVTLRKGERFERFVSRLSLREPLTVKEGIEQGEERLMHAREIWAASNVLRLQPKFALLDRQRFERAVESRQMPGPNIVSYVTLFVQGKRLVALKVDIDTNDSGDRTSATVRSVF